MVALSVVTYRALVRCARRVEAARGVEHLRRNAADMVIRATNPRLPPELYEASIACAEVGPVAAVRAAFEAGDDIDRAVRSLPAAHEVARFAEILDRRRSFFARDDERDEELAACEAVGFRIAALLGASDEEIERARRRLEERAASIDTNTSLWAFLQRLDTACLAWTRSATNFGDARAHRLDVVVDGGPGIPVALCLAVLGVARRAGYTSDQIFGVGAPGRFLLAVRGVGVATPDLRGLKRRRLDDDWFDNRDLLTVSIAPASPHWWGDTPAAMEEEAVATTTSGEVKWRVLLRGDLRVGDRLRAILHTKGEVLETTCVVLSDDEILLAEDRHLRRATPTSPRAAVFIDCYDSGRRLTRAQILRQRDPVADDLEPPLPQARAAEIARRMSRNLHFAARQRNDLLEAMLFSHAELDLQP